MFVKNSFLICLLFLTLVFLFVGVKRIITKKEIRKEKEQQREEWREELGILSEAMQEMLKEDIKALETYKMIEEIYSVYIYAPTDACRQMSQRRRLFSYKKKYSDLPREEYLYLLHLRRKRKKFYKDTV